LQNMETASTDDLDEIFVDEVVKTVNAIYSDLPLKYIGSSTMKGIAFVKFLENIIERMNSSETSTFLSITIEYDSVIQFVEKKAIKEAMGRYNEKMKVFMSDLPILWDKFEEMHDECNAYINKLYFEKIIGSPKQMGRFIEQLKEETIRRKET